MFKTKPFGSDGQESATRETGSVSKNNVTEPAQKKHFSHSEDRAS